MLAEASPWEFKKRDSSMTWVKGNGNTILHVKQHYSRVIRYSFIQFCFVYLLVFWVFKFKTWCLHSRPFTSWAIFPVHLLNFVCQISIHACALTLDELWLTQYCPLREWPRRLGVPLTLQSPLTHRKQQALAGYLVTTVLTNFMSTWPMLELFERKEPQLRKMSPSD